MIDLATRPRDNRPGNGRRYSRQISLWYVFLIAVLLMTILMLVLVLLVRDDNDEVETVAPTLTTIDGQASSTVVQASTTTTITATTTTTAATTLTTQTTTTIDPQQYRSAVWPDPASAVRYAEPRAAARGFAEDFLGFGDPVVGPFLQGDSRSGEVEFRPTDTGPVTTVFVRQLDAAGTWWILGSVTGNISLESPGGLEEIDSPLVVSGSALAFEGVVDVELRADGSTSPLTEGSVIGGGTSQERFERSFEWVNPGEGAGALILMTISMEDGQPWEAVVVRVLFAGG